MVCDLDNVFVNVCVFDARVTETRVEGADAVWTRFLVIRAATTATDDIHSLLSFDFFAAFSITKFKSSTKFCANCRFVQHRYETCRR